ncbi:hypothetical protein FRC12_003161 [Ceratobasidium sp. 428]|nr:hypothetical protein FRC12_003161 [Ceratobasidium sp. 428]
MWIATVVMTSLPPTPRMRWFCSIAFLLGIVERVVSAIDIAEAVAEIRCLLHIKLLVNLLVNSDRNQHANCSKTNHGSKGVVVALSKALDEPLSDEAGIVTYNLAFLVALARWDSSAADGVGKLIVRLT